MAVACVSIDFVFWPITVNWSAKISGQMKYIPLHYEKLVIICNQDDVP